MKETTFPPSYSSVWRPVDYLRIRSTPLSRHWSASPPTPLYTGWAAVLLLATEIVEGKFTYGGSSGCRGLTSFCCPWRRPWQKLHRSQQQYVSPVMAQQANSDWSISKAAQRHLGRKRQWSQRRCIPTAAGCDAKSDQQSIRIKISAHRWSPRCRSLKRGQNSLMGHPSCLISDRCGLRRIMSNVFAAFIHWTYRYIYNRECPTCRLTSTESALPARDRPED